MLPGAVLSYLVELHPAQLLLQDGVLHGQHLGLALRLHSPSTLSGELRLEAAQGLLQRGPLLLT